MKRQEKLVVLGLALLLVTESAFAGSGGAFVDGIKTFLIESLQGTVGMVIGLAGLAFGLFAGIMRGSLAQAGGGFGLAAGAYYGPDIIVNMATATLAIL